MADKIFNDVRLSVKWKTDASDVRPDIEGEKDEQGYCNENLATTLGKVARYLKDYDAFESHGHALTDDNITGTLPISKGGTGATSASAARTALGLGTAATANTESTVANDSKLPTGSAVKTFVEGKGYVTSSGVTNVASGDGLTGGPINSTGTLKANLKDYTKASVGVLALTNPTANTKFYPVSLDKDGKLGVSVPWTYTDTKVTSAANHYTPSADSGSALSVDADSSTAATWGTTALVTGVNIERDAKGHVTGLTLDSIKMPSNPNTNTTYTFAEGTTNGAFSVTPSGGSVKSVPIHGLGSAAYTASTAYAAASHNHNASNITSGTLGVAHGGTGATTFTSGQVLIGNGTNAVSTKAIDTTVTSGSANLITSGAVYSQIENKISALGQVFNIKSVGQYASVSDLPTTGNEVGDVHLIAESTAGGTYDSYEEYVWIIPTGSSAGKWEYFGKLHVDINDADTSRKGIVQLSSATNSSSEALAATPKAVKAAYDLAASKTSNTGTVTKVTAGTGLTGGDITTTGTIALSTSGVTANTYGPSQTAATTASNGTKIRVPKLTVDTYGRVTNATYIEFTAADHTYSAFTGASSSAAGAAGLVKAPAAGDQAKYLRGDGNWATPTDTDTKVTQTVTTSNATYEVLFSSTASSDNTTKTEGARKNNNLTFNPSTGTLAATVVTVNTQASTDNTTKVATTAFVHAAAICEGDTLVLNCI
jgi:hypothetical protein